MKKKLRANIFYRPQLTHLTSSFLPSAPPPPCFSSNFLPTVILFWVSVPVLSDAIVVIEPSVSTDSICFTYTFLRASRRAVTVRQACEEETEGGKKLGEKIEGGKEANTYRNSGRKPLYNEISRMK